jgi:RNA polymerase sigma factor (sigma-70 family)
MSGNRPGALLRQLQTLTDARAVQRLTDAELLERFVLERDETAFAALVRRHGGMVWSVGRNVLHHEADAEDAFQATFLVLARRADSIRKRQSLASWLHGVAHRTALGIRQSALRRRRHEQAAQQGTAASAASEAALRELQVVLEEEVQSLPEHYRASFVLCHLEGKSRAEAALELGCRVGTVLSRLARARRLLRQRLARRGIALSAALCAAALARRAPASTVGPLVARVTRAALAFRAGDALQSIPGRVTACAEGVLKVLTPAKVNLLSLGAVLLGVLTAVGLVWQQGRPGAAIADCGLRSADSRDTPQSAIRTPQSRDLHGDPLPEHALFRVGTARLQHRGLAHHLAVSADRRLLASCGQDGVVRVWDARDGKPLRQFELSRWGAWAVAFSHDGKELGAVSRSPGQGGQPHFRRWDLATGRELPSEKAAPLAFESTIVHVAVAARPGGGYLAAETAGADIRVYRPGRAGAGQSLRGHRGRVMSVAFLEDGKKLISLGDDGTVRFWDVATGEPLTTMPAPAMKGHGLRGNLAWLAASSDGRTLAVALPDGSTRLLDAAGRELRRLPSAGSVEALAFSPDGKHLYTGGALIRAWDVATGKEISLLDEPRRPIQMLSLAPDGKTVAFADGADGLRLADVATGKTLCRARIACRSGIAFAPDGQQLAAAPGDRTIALWETARLRVAERPFERPEEMGTVPFLQGDSPHFFRTLFAGKPAAVLSCRANVATFAFAPDGKRLATAEEDGFVRIYDIATQRLLLTIRPSGRKVFAVAFAPDGKVLATMGTRGMGPAGDGDAGLQGLTQQAVRLWNTATGKQVAIGEEMRRTAHTVVFHPSGHALAALHLPAAAKAPLVGYIGKASTPPAEDRLETVRLWDRGFVREKCRFEDPVQRQNAEKIMAWVIGRSSAQPAAFSRDGRVFATPGVGGIVLYETASGQPRLRLAGHLQEVTGLAFTPDGRTLVSSSQDSTVLIWDVTGLRTAGRLTASAERLWALLADPGPERAGQAVWSMVATPTNTLAVLRERLRPVPAGRDPVPKLVAALDDPKFSVREKAMKALARLGPAAEEALADKLRAGTSLETTKRIAQLLARMKAAPSPEQLREARGVEVLERIGTPEARDQLRDLANGAAGAWLTRLAREAYDRLNRR